jgi:hypothetical protein
MAKLDYNEILKYDSRQVVFYSMLLNGSSFEVAFDTGSTQIAGTVVIEKLFYKESDKLVNIPFTTDNQVLGNLKRHTTNVYMQVKMDAKTKRAWAATIKSDPETDFIMRLNRLYKGKDWKDGKTDYNRGDVAEGIQSAALVARFMKEKPNMTVTKTDVEAVIASLGSWNGTTSFTIADKFTSPNKEVAGIPLAPDKIIYTIGLAAPHMEAFLSSRVRSTKMVGIYDSAIAYANSNIIKEWDKEFYENGRRDIITVKAQGLEDQKGTKKDLDISFTDETGQHRKTALELSIKSGGVKQFSQRGGTLFSTLEKLMGEFYGVSLTGIKAEYTRLLNAIPGRPDVALSLAYSVGQKKWGNGMIVKWPEAQKKRFAAATKYHAQKDAGEIPQLNLLDSGTPDYKDFNLLHDNLMKYNYFSIENRESTGKGGTLPRHIIRIHDSQSDYKGKQILEIRVKIETQKKVTGDRVYFRSVIENSTDTSILVGKDI